ncbi:MAG: sulfite exporter TauE/SafE family protein, partial [Treponema sp.]|nr:sulfite exporter TauE/SafE family protein [Treponema sp.]
MKTDTIRIGGMTCVSCQNRIEKKLKNTTGIEDARVNFNTGTATVTYNASIITLHEIANTIEKLDYRVLDEDHRESKIRAAGILVIILALYMLLRQFGFGALTGAFPLAEAGMGYGMLFIIGLVTSVHCVAMCGGINLSQCIPAGTRLVPADLGVEAPRTGGAKRFRVLLPSIFYNAGRIVSYTLVGAIVGALGSAVTVTGATQGIVQLAAGIFMIIMGINMLGIFPGLRRFTLRMPGIFARKIDAGREHAKNPLFVGLLNGLMPCGPLQAMQLYALSTGSPVRGAVSMLLFSLGTVPLMFGVGALGSVLSDTARGRSFSSRVTQIGAVLVTVLGLAMFSNGWSLGGFSGLLSPLAGLFNAPAPPAAPAFEPVIVDGTQLVNSTLSPGRYPAITVREGIPVKWTINVPQGSVNGCNNRMIIREYGIEHRFETGENVIEFMPERTGRFPYSCWMGMIRSSITVVAEDTAFASVDDSAELAPVPAGVDIPVDDIAIAEINGGRQRVRLELGDDGFKPSVVVMQRSLETDWVIGNDSLDEGNGTLIFPYYYARLPVKNGDNTIRLRPSEDFEFSTVDYVYYGYVKVV